MDAQQAAGQGHRVHLFLQRMAVVGVFFIPLGARGWAAAESAMQEATEMAAGVSRESGVRLSYNESTRRLEIRDDVGSLLEELTPGTISRTVDAAGKEYRLSFGRDEMNRPSVLVRPGPAMRKPLLIDVFGRKAVLSPNASLLATLADNEQVFYEPSICGEVYYIEDMGNVGQKVSRLATSRREVAVLARPSSPTGAGPGTLESSREDGKGMEKAGEAFKSAVFTVFGLPDKQPAARAKVYRLKGSSGSETPNEAAEADPQ